MKPLKLFLAACFALYLGLAGAQPASPNNRDLLLAGKFSELERLFAAQAASSVRDQNGELPSVMYFHSFNFGAGNIQWTQEDAQTSEWLRQFPQSPAAAIARASALLRRSSVLDRAGDWAGTEALLREQLKVLTAVQQKAANDVTWHSTYVVLGRQLGWPRAKMRSAVLAGIKADPTSMYFLVPAARALMPDPRQSPEPLAWLAKEVAARTRASHGLAMYANLYIWTAQLNQAVRTEPFRGGLVDWKLMDRGLVDLYRLQPSDGLLNHHAALACLAGDKRATAERLKAVGTRVISSVWTSWGGEPLYERCKSWAQAGATTS